MLAWSKSVLRLAQEQIKQIDHIYARSLRAREVSGRLQALVKNVLDNQRSALEFVAYAVVETHGNSAKLDKVYWPNTDNPAKFKALFRENIPGVSKRAIEEAFERHQQYQTGNNWAEYLFPLSIENKHHRLSPQTNQLLVPPPILTPARPGVTTVIAPTVVFTDWLFARYDISVMDTLKAIQRGVSAAAQDVSRAAGL